MKKILLLLSLIFLVSCAGQTSKVDPSISDDLINISKALSEGKSILEALGEVK